MTSNTNYPTERNSYDAAKSRCNSEANKNYNTYGGAGVTFYEGWDGPNGFDRFLAHIGPKPTPDHSIDRIDNSRGYEPGNVRWATRIEQNRNRSCARLTPAELDYVRFISDMFQMDYNCIRTRYARGVTSPTDLQVPPRVQATRAATVRNREDVSMLYRRGMGRAQIARRLDLHVTTVSDIIKYLEL
ncbi:helix-turn-helix domain-containing protein [Sphingomonas sp. NFX23]|uniref:helix-turn-helix domain-containing protein n=1 Tax=Sphingomonas sp. NFX23 TaxID=2819532 RepID=UPI003CF25F1D